MVLIGEVLTQIRNQALDIDAAATNHAVQTQTSQAKNLAVKAPAQHLVACLRQKYLLRLTMSHRLASESRRVNWETFNSNSSGTRTKLGHPPTPTPRQGHHFPQHLQAVAHQRTRDLLLLHLTSTPPAPLLRSSRRRSQIPGQPHSFSPSAPPANLTKHEQSPQEGSNWLATHLPGKFQEREIKAWVNSFTLNDRKKNELQDWLKQVEAWLEAQTDDGFITKIRRAAVVWGIPPGTVTKLQKQPLGRLIAVGSFMER